jgi:hypothetical protein
MVEGFVRRWQLEVTFEEARRHLGIETQRALRSSFYSRFVLFFTKRDIIIIEGCLSY